MSFGCAVDAVDNKGTRPLHDAAYKGINGLITILMDRGADVNCQDRSGVTPLHWAAANGQVEACQLLIDEGAGLNTPDLSEDVRFRINNFGRQNS